MRDFKSLNYLTMPVDAGQIVVVAYAIDATYLYRRSCDQSDNTASYSRATLDLESNGNFEPQNNSLPIIGDWEEYVTRFHLSDDGSSEEIESDDMDSAKEEAEELWKGGDWDEKCRISVRIQEIDWDDNDVGDPEWIAVECGEDPASPDCDEDDHEWETPHAVVGGLDSNPGCWSTGGTSMKFKSVCKHCGIYRIEHHTGAQYNPGEVDTVEYEDADEDSLKFVEENK